MKYLKQFGIILLISLGGSCFVCCFPCRSGKCIWTGLNADRTYDRNNKNSSDQRSICFFDRNHAGDVYSGRSRTFRSMAVASTGVDTGCCHFVCYDNYCNGSDRTRSTENHREGEKRRWNSFSLIQSFSEL